MYTFNSVYKRSRHELRDSTRHMIFRLFNILYEIVPVLVVLNLCNVTHISWWILAGMWILYVLIGYMEELIAMYYQKKDEREAEAFYAEQRRIERRYLEERENEDDE